MTEVPPSRSASDAPGRSLWPVARPSDVAACLTDAEVHVWWMDLDMAPRDLERLETWLDDEELARAARFRSDTLRGRHIAAHGQMRALLGAYLNTPPKNIRIAAGDLGKPSVVEPGAGPAHSAIEFNLSHSRGEGLLAITRAAAVGADVEVRHALTDLDELARQHFTDEEQHELRSLPLDRKEDGFFAGWTRKEAYVKALGAGLTTSLQGFCVALDPDRPAALRSIDSDTSAASGWTLWADRPTRDSWAAVAVRRPAADVQAFALPSLLHRLET